MLDKEYNNIRNGYLTLYILKYIEMKPKVNMSPFGALIAQEIDSKNQLGAGKSLVFSRLNKLCEGEYLSFSWKESPNPRVKKKVKFFSITAKGKKLISKLQNEQARINKVLANLPA